MLGRELEALHVIERQLRRERLDAAVEPDEEDRRHREQERRGKRQRQPGAAGDSGGGPQPRRAAIGVQVQAAHRCRSCAGALVQSCWRLASSTSRAARSRGDPLAAGAARCQVRGDLAGLSGGGLAVDVGRQERLERQARRMNVLEAHDGIAPRRRLASAGFTHIAASSLLVPARGRGPRVLTL